MGLLDKLINPRRLMKAAQELAGEAYIRVQRLEIELRDAQTRVKVLEEQVAALAHKVHGQAGGRPRTRPNGSGIEMPMPVGAQLFPPTQEKR